VDSRAEEGRRQGPEASRGGVRINWGGRMAAPFRKESIMGDRALVILKSGESYSPVMYLHWHAPQVGNYVRRLKDVMESRGEDLGYSFARLLGIVHNDIDGNLSLGCWNLPKGFSEANSKMLREMSHGDGGIYVVDLKDYSIATYAGYGLAHQNKRDGGEADRVAAKAVELSRTKDETVAASVAA
jgi:hypothetical protein